MQTAHKSRILIGIIALFTGAVLSSCTDISGPTVEIYTPPARTKPAVTAAELSETTSAAVGYAADAETVIAESSPFESAATSDETQEQTSYSDTAAEPETLAVAETTAAPETTAPPETAAAPETSALTATAPEKPAQTEALRSKDYNVIGQNGILVSYQNGHYRGIMPCFGTYSLCERWAGALNTFAEKLPGVDVYSLTVPIASEFYTPQSFWDSGFTTSQFNKTEHIRTHLSGVRYIDAYSALSEHRDEDIYLRTDHHWTPLGAYYAAGKFAATAGIAFPAIEEYTPVSRSGYVGTMYTYSKDVHLYNDAETFTMYLPPNVDRLETTYYNTSFDNAFKGDLFVARNASSFYCSYLGSDDRIAHIRTDVANNRTLVVFKQSYGNALIPFLTSGFENIYVCDMRYFDLNALQFCKDVGATDVLCTDCIMIAAGNGGKYLESILAK